MLIGPPVMARRLLYALAGLSLATISCFHWLSISRQIERPPHADESEHLHVTWLISRGQHMYRDFLEDHSPLLEVGLLPLVPRATRPAFPRLDVPRFLRSARFAIGLCGVLS